MPVPFRPLSPDSNHLQGPQDAMKVSAKANLNPPSALGLITLCKEIYKKHPTAFLLPIIKDAPLSVKLPSDVSLHGDPIAYNQLTSSTDLSG